MPFFSFTYDLDQCPNCETPLTNDEGPPSIAVDNHDDTIKTTIGEEGNFYHAYILDPVGDGCLILDNRKPNVRCIACNHAIPVDPHEE